MEINLRQGNQKYNLLDSKYKIIWSYNNTSKFFFTDAPVIWARNKYLGIGSDNRKELLYLFSLLNSKIAKMLLTKLIKIQHEETRTILVSIQIIKDQMRVPKINDDNMHIKNKIIEFADEMLQIEEKTLSDFIDFSGLLVQKFCDIGIIKDYLYLKHNDKQIRLKIKNNLHLVENEVRRELIGEELKFDAPKISLNKIKSLPIIDFKRQEKLKEHIDNLIFALYFQIPINKTIINEDNRIKKICTKNQYYKLCSSIQINK